MKYSKSGDKKNRITIKGGKLQEDGKLNKRNFENILSNQVFELQNMSNKVNDDEAAKNALCNKRPIRKTLNNNNNNSTFELQNMSNKVNEDKIQPIKIMEQKRTSEPYFFFGYDPITKKHKYVCHNPSFFSFGSEPIFHELKENGSIDKLTHEQILKIPIKKLLEFVYQFLIKRKTDKSYMMRLFIYLHFFVLPIISNTKFDKYWDKISKKSIKMDNEDYRIVRFSENLD